MRLYYSDQYEIPLPAGTSSFRFGNIGCSRGAGGERRVSSSCLRRSPIAETIELVHDSEYVRGFLDGSLPAGVMRRIGFPWSDGLVLRTLASVGSTLRGGARCA